MPLRAPKPFYRIDTLSDRHRITHYRSANRQLLQSGWIEVGKGDKVAFEEEVGLFVDMINAKWRKKE